MGKARRKQHIAGHSTVTRQVGGNDKPQDCFIAGVPLYLQDSSSFFEDLSLVSSAGIVIKMEGGWEFPVDQ